MFLDNFELKLFKIKSISGRGDREFTFKPPSNGLSTINVKEVTFNTVLFLLIWFEEAFVFFIRIDF